MRPDHSLKRTHCGVQLKARHEILGLLLDTATVRLAQTFGVTNKFITSATRVFALAALVACSSGAAFAVACFNLPPQQQYDPPLTPRDGCVCGPALQRITLTVQPPFVLRAACDLRWSTADSQVLIDIAKDRVSFDQYTNGHLPQGRLLFAGQTSLKGTLVYSPGPAGEWWFSLSTPLAKVGPARELLGGFKLWQTQSPSALGVPKSLRNVECWKAAATIEIQDIWLTLGDSDEAGAYPSKYKVSKISRYQRCK